MMRIVDLTTFRAMPPGTVFQKWAPDYWEALEIKEDTLPSDFVATAITEIPVSSDDMSESDDLCRRMRAGEDVPVNLDFTSRDGLYDREQLFAVWAPDDVRALIEQIQRAL